MIDNYFQQVYHSYDKVYTHPVHHNHIYIGDVQSAMDHHFHQSHRIKLIVTAASEMEQVVVSPGITHIRYNLLDGKKENISNLFHQFYQLVEQHIVNANILVHCAAGISRSATLVISYLIKREKLSFKDAVGLVRKGRASVLPNLGFERQLKRYEQFLSSKKQSRETKRSTKRSEVKTSQSGKYHLPSANQGTLEYQPQISLAGFRHQPQPHSLKKPFNRLSQKQMQIFKIYGANSTNQQKPLLQYIKPATKDSHNHNNNLEPGVFFINKPGVKQKQSPFIHRTIKYHRKYPRRMKTSVEQIKEGTLVSKMPGMVVIGQNRHRSKDFANML